MKFLSMMPNRSSFPVSCISSLSGRGARSDSLKCVHRLRTTYQESPKMITAFFTAVTVAFFAIAVQVVTSVASLRG